MWNKYSILTCLFTLLVLFGYGQRRQYSGVVVDSTTNEVLEGVVIQNMNTPSIVAKTNDRGEFTIMSYVRDVISFSFVGYTKQNYIATNLPRKIYLNQETRDIDEVVVIGYGTVNKKDFTGSLSEVNVEDINKAPVPNIAQALAGRVAGLQVNALSGQPGEESDIIIRGGNSITQDNSPLYVVDGFPIEGFSLSSINPEEIAELQVLKDASATSIYGSRGANGVVIIETKKGQEGVPQISYNLDFGMQRATKFMDMMDAYEFVKYQTEFNPDNEEMYLTRQDRTLEDYKNVQTHDWQDMLFRNALMHNHNLAVRGGSRGTKYAFSGNVTNQDGVVINSGFSRYQGRARIDQELSNKLRVNLNVSYSKDQNYGQLNNQQASGNNSYATYIMYRTWGYRPVSTTGNLEELLFDDDEDGGETLLVMNPIISTRNEFREQNRTFFTSNLGLDYDLPWNLQLNMRGGYRWRQNRDEAFNNSKTYRGFPHANNADGVNGSFSENSYTDWMNENTLTYKNKWDNKHTFDALVGLTVQGQNTDRYGYTSVHIPNEELGIRALEYGNIKSPISTASKNALLSYLGRVNYNYRGKYYLTGSFRIDGSSKFAPQHRWGYFPAVAASWRLGREQFMKNISFVSDSKLRVSWGVTGNNRVNDFAPYSTVTLDDRYGIGSGGAIPEHALVLNRFGNKELKWESTYQFDIGYELSLFKNRLNFVFDYYNKDTKDLLLNANVPYAVGFQRIYKNIGSIQNRGFEIEVNSVNVSKKNFTWNSSFNISFNRNKIMALTDDERTMFTNVPFTASWNSANLYIAQVNKPVSSFYGLVWDGVYQTSDFDQLSNGSYILKDEVASLYEDRTRVQPGDIKYRDVNGDMLIDEKDKVVIGRTLPKHYGGFNNNFTYKNFNLNVFFQWNYGNNVMNANRLMFEGNMSNRAGLNQFASYTDRWTIDNPSNEYFRVRGGGPVGYYSTRELEDGSYIRLKTVQLAYRLPKHWIPRVSSVDLSVAAQNLYTWSNYSGLDPEISTRNSILTPGFDYSAYAQNFTISFGAKVVF